MLIFFEDSNVFMVVKSLEPKYETPYGPQNSCCQMALSSNILGSNIMRVKNLYVENRIFNLKTLSPNMSTTPLRQWGFQQCLPFSWTTLSGKHCWHPIAIMGVVDTFRPSLPGILERTNANAGAYLARQFQFAVH